MQIYSTLSGKKEEFTPLGEEVKMYVCGVTPYSDSHIGHAMSAIYFDVFRRFLKYRGYKVKYVQNITDIDDKLIMRANRDGKTTEELSRYYIQRLSEDLAALNVEPADVQPRATEEIPKMLEVIRGLVDKGFAYPSEGSVYFRVNMVKDYGELSHRRIEDMISGDVVSRGEEKESPLDFVLWKASKPGEPAARPLRTLKPMRTFRKHFLWPRHCPTRPVKPRQLFCWASMPLNRERPTRRNLTIPRP